ncbi:hypothetical protein LCGC14_0455180 [marine sediment metagenome]|uniref:Uncharacterized protein n=1 Tax=marine sediment metagenome TaxID=412755 RepID=A0A0F9SLV8_9ZZZZ
MADEKVVCPDCDGDGRSWDGDDFCSDDCETCEGEGEVIEDD